MMQTVTVDLINEKALKLLQHLELLQLIRLRKEKTHLTASTDWATKYKGAMTKQPFTDMDNHLNELPNGWESLHFAIRSGFYMKIKIRTTMSGI